MSRRLAVAIAVAAALCGCRPVAVPPSQETHRSHTTYASYLPLPEQPAARLTALRAREDEIRTLRVRFDAEVSDAAGESRSAGGVLLVAKPDRFRLRLVLPFGLTAFDYLRAGQQSWVTLPLASGRHSNAAPFAGGDLEQVFLRGPAAFPGECAAAAAGGDLVWVSCGDGEMLRRTLLVGRDGVIEETAYEDDVPVLRIRYGDYRAAGDTVLPFRIAVDDVPAGRTVDIAVERYEVNLPLADDLFAPPPGAEPQGSGLGSATNHG